MRKIQLIATFFIVLGSLLLFLETLTMGLMKDATEKYFAGTSAVLGGSWALFCVTQTEGVSSSVHTEPWLSGCLIMLRAAQDIAKMLSFPISTIY